MVNGAGYDRKGWDEGSTQDKSLPLLTLPASFGSPFELIFYPSIQESNAPHSDKSGSARLYSTHSY
jgi:hypothetical protein